MSEPPNDPPPNSRWAGRAILLFFGALLLIYFVPLAIKILTHGQAFTPKG